MEKKEYVAHKWYSKTIYVDIETGEIISKKLANRDYIILKTEKKNRIWKIQQHHRIYKMR